jgi:hypothetical protein
MADFLLGFICGFSLMAAVVRLALAFGIVQYRSTPRDSALPCDTSSPADRRKLLNRPWSSP